MKAAEVLASQRCAQAVEPFIEIFLNDRDVEIRCYLAQLFEQLEDSRFLPILVEALHEKNRRVRLIAVETIGNLVSMFGGTHDDYIVEAMIEAFSEERDPSIKACMVTTLGKMSDPRVIPLLVQAVGDRNIEIRLSAIRALGHRKCKQALDMIIDALNDGCGDIRSAAAWALGEIADEQAIPALIEAARDRDAIVRSRVAKALGRIGSSQGVDVLTELLKDEDKYVRRTAAWALGEIADERAVYPLVDALNDNDSGVRQMAVWALSKMDNNIMVLDALVELLKVEENLDVLQELYTALSSMGEIAIAPLIEILGEGDRSAWRKAVSALSKMSVPAIHSLLEALKSDNPEVREGVIFALEQMKEEGVPSLIKEFKETDDRLIRENIITILVQMGPSILRMLLQDVGLDLNENIPYFYMIPLLVDGLDSEEPFVRETSELILSKIGAPFVLQLIDRLKFPDNPYIFEEIKKVLIAIGNPAFIPVVENLLSSTDPNLQEAAVDIIKGIAEEKREQETGLDPDLDIRELNWMSEEELETIASGNEYSITRALALYYLGKKYKSAEFLKDYIFNEDENGKLFVRNEGLTKLEMAAILNTGIPAEKGWWNKLAEKNERIKYIKLILKGDFTDERLYIYEERNWVCVQYAIQMCMNGMGYDELNFAEKEVFLEYGAGFKIFSIQGYGLPIYYALTEGHAFNAVFIGENLFRKDREGNFIYDSEDSPVLTEEAYDINNWILVEPMDDDYSPNILIESVKIYLKPFFQPDGWYGGFVPDSNYVELNINNYLYGSDS